MEILGIGMSELIFILILALIVMGPKDMQKAGRTLATWVNKVVQSSGWRAMQQTRRELNNLRVRMMREANLAEAYKRELMKATNLSASDAEKLTQPIESEPSIAPPGSKEFNPANRSVPKARTKKTNAASEGASPKKTSSSRTQRSKKPAATSAQKTKKTVIRKQKTPNA